MEEAARQLVLTGKANLLRIAAIPFSEAAAAFLGWAEGEYAGEKRASFLRIRSSFSFIKHFFGKAIVSAITEGQIDDFKSARRKIEIKEVSIRNDLHALSLFFQYAVRKHWARENVVRKVSIPSSAEAMRINVLSPEQERMYFETCRWMDRAAQFIASSDQKAYRDLHDFGRLMIQQGCRPEEVIELRKVDVDLMGRWMHIRAGKTRAARRRLKLTAESAEILVRRMSTPGPFVFPSPRDSKKHRGVTWRSHGEVLAAMKGKPGAPNFVSYDLRHTFATRAVVDGMPLPVLAAILGHANLKSIEKYVHISSEHMDAETLRIEALREQRRVKSFAGFLPGTPVGTVEEETKTVKSGEN